MSSATIPIRMTAVVSLFLLSALPTFACGEDGRTGATPSGTATSVLPSSSVPIAPTSATALPADPVVDAFAAGDPVKVLHEMDPFPRPCSTSKRFEPECPEGKTDGQSVNVVRSNLSCSNPGWLQTDEMTPEKITRYLTFSLSGFEQGWTLRATADGETSGEFVQGVPGLLQFLFFSNKATSEGLVVGTSEHGIRMLTRMCLQNVDQMIAGRDWKNVRRLTP